MDDRPLPFHHVQSQPSGVVPRPLPPLHVLNSPFLLISSSCHLLACDWMYIRRRLQVSAVHPRPEAPVDAQSHGLVDPALRLFRRGLRDVLVERQFSSNPSTNNNIKIGLIVGFVLAAFLAVVIVFLWLYCGSIRFTYKKKKHRHHHHRHKSVSSRGSRGSDRSAPPSPKSATEETPPAEDKPADG